MFATPWESLSLGIQACHGASSMALQARLACSHTGRPQEGTGQLGCRQVLLAQGQRGAAHCSPGGLFPAPQHSWAWLRAGLAGLMFTAPFTPVTPLIWVIIR